MLPDAQLCWMKEDEGEEEEGGEMLEANKTPNFSYNYHWSHAVPF